MAVEMKSTNTKVIRMLKALAIDLKDEDPKLLIKIHKTINNKQDGYDFNFLEEAETVKIQVKGRSY
jgi:hypothetical protein